MKKKILILCTGNSCRSQIAEAYLKIFTKDKADVFSAGIEAHGMNPYTIKTMSEDQIDISDQYSKTLDQFIAQHFDYIITVCDSAFENCPIFPGNADQIHKSFSDPAKAKGTEEEILFEFAKVRDEIKLFCKEIAISLLS